MKEKSGFPGFQNKHSKAKSRHPVARTPEGSERPLPHKHRGSRGAPGSGWLLPTQPGNSAFPVSIQRWVSTAP